MAKDRLCNLESCKQLDYLIILVFLSIYFCEFSHILNVDMTHENALEGPADAKFTTT